MKKLGALAVALLLSATSCLEREPGADYRESIQVLLNQRRYDEAIHSLESKVRDPDGATPANEELLAQAHLGAAGFELVSFADRVLDIQRAQARSVTRLFPACTLERMAALPGLEEPEFKCLLKRLLLQLPDANDPHVARARQLLRAAYPDVSAASEPVNFLIAAVELGSAFSRAGTVLDFFLDPPPEAGSWAAPQYPARLRSAALELKTFLEETRLGLGRASRSSERVAKFLFGLKGNAVFKQVEQTLQFAEVTGVPALLKFADQADQLLASPENRELLNAITQFAREFTGQIAQNPQTAPPTPLMDTP